MSSLSHSQAVFWQEHCAVLQPERARLVLVGFGALVALLSVSSNLFLLFVLCRRRHLNSPFLYLAPLSLADVFLSAAYILLFVVNLGMDELESEFLSSAWWSYMPSVLCLSHLAITASAFLIVAATAERYVTISKFRREFSRKLRIVIISSAIFIALITKLPVFFEVKVVANANCTGVTAWTATVAEFSESEPYKTLYKFWVRNVVSVLLPFTLLFLLNLAIIRRLYAQQKAAMLFRFRTSTHRRNIRSATLLLVCVTCTYLASNLLNVVVNIWESIDRVSLLTEEIRPLYTYSSDLVSLFTVMASCLRLPIYYICNVRLRGEIRRVLSSLLSSRLRRKSGGSHLREIKEVSTVRYCQSGNGFVIYQPRGSTHVSRSIGTRLDRVVLALAMGNAVPRPATPSSLSLPPSFTPHSLPTSSPLLHPPNPSRVQFLLPTQSDSIS